jgi:hypothetical protein
MSCDMIADSSEEYAGSILYLEDEDSTSLPSVGENVRWRQHVSPKVNLYQTARFCIPEYNLLSHRPENFLNFTRSIWLPAHSWVVPKILQK